MFMSARAATINSCAPPTMLSARPRRVQRPLRILPCPFGRRRRRNQKCGYLNHGCQVAALNYQTSDAWMQANRGCFRNNGGSTRWGDGAHLDSSTNSSEYNHRHVRQCCGVTWPWTTVLLTPVPTL